MKVITVMSIPGWSELQNISWSMTTKLPETLSPSCMISSYTHSTSFTFIDRVDTWRMKLRINANIKQISADLSLMFMLVFMILILSVNFLSVEFYSRFNLYGGRSVCSHVDREIETESARWEIKKARRSVIST